MDGVKLLLEPINPNDYIKFLDEQVLFIFENKYYVSYISFDDEFGYYVDTNQIVVNLTKLENNIWHLPRNIKRRSPNESER